jgi:peptidoglycan endopeptidase LytE
VSEDPGRQEVVQYAKTFLGTPYRDGGATRDGLDCSGLVMTVYGHFQVPLPRTSLDQSYTGDKVARSSVEPGDLVFFKTTRRSVGHVGIYIGKGQFIHASTSARRVRVDDMNSEYFRPRFVMARRVID